MEAGLPEIGVEHDASNLALLWLGWHPLRAVLLATELLPTADRRLPSSDSVAKADADSCRVRMPPTGFLDWIRFTPVGIDQAERDAHYGSILFFVMPA